MLPADIQKRDLIKNYLQEAIKHTNDKDLADVRLKQVFESVKESEASLDYTVAEFKEALAAALKYEKTQAIVDKKQAALDTVDTLKV